MAPGRTSNSKRKRSSISDSHQDTSTPPKRRKSNAGRPSKAKPADEPPAKFWVAKSILQETQTQYRIDWANDPETGEVYSPTWEPKAHANHLLVADWKRKKKEKKSASKKRKPSVEEPVKKSASKKRKPSAEEPESTPAPAPVPNPAAVAASRLSTSPAPAPQLETTPRRESRVTKRRRIVHSSSPEPRSAPDQLPAPSSAPATDSRHTPETEPQNTRSRTEPAVFVTRPADCNFSDYDPVSASQVPWSSQAAPESSPQLQQSSSTAESSEASVGFQRRSEHYNIPAETLLQQPRFENGAVIPDSQSLHGDSSYVPSTQTRSGAESQAAGTQSRPLDSSASGSAQFTNPQEDDTSAPVEETDPIEDGSSSPAAHSHHEERVPPPRESPWQTASSASSPPPTESPDKSTQSESLVANTQASVEAQVGAQAVDNERTQDFEAETSSRPLSPKSRPEERRRPSPETQEPQQTTVEEYIAEESERSAEKIDHDLAGPVEEERPQDWQVLVPQSGSIEEQQHEHPVPEVEDRDEEDRHEPELGEAATADITPAVLEDVQDSGHEAFPDNAPAVLTVPEREEEVVPAEHTAAESEAGVTCEAEPTTSHAASGSEKDIAAEVALGSAQGSGQKSAEGEQTEHQNESTGSAVQAAGTEEVHHFVTCPEGPADGATGSLIESAKEAQFPLQDQADVSTQDVSDPSENSSHLQFAQTDFALVHDFDSTTSPKETVEQTNPDLHSEVPQAAQFAPELDLDGAGSSYRSQISELGHSNEIRKRTQSSRRKDSSQDNLEPSVLSQADPNVVRRHYEADYSDDLGSKDIVASVETRVESPIRRGYYRKISRGMPQTPQPNSAAGGIDPSTPGSLTERLREVHARSKAERERKKAEILARTEEAFRKSPSLGASTRSPSVIPPNGTSSMEPQYTLIPSNLSAETRPHQSHLPNSQNNHTMTDTHHVDTEMNVDSTPTVLLDEPVLGEAEYLIGLSMEGLQGDQYRREIRFKEVPITRFVDDDPPCEVFVQEIDDMLRRVGNIITHMDLGFANADALTQYSEDYPDRGMVAWSNNSSTKFRFLGGILDRLRNTKFHFVIMGHHGTLMDIIEKFVNGLEIQYSRGGHVDREAFENRESLFVSIIGTGTGFDSVDPAIPPAHLIFAMDSTVQCHDPKMKALRNHLRGPKDSIPVITPIVTNSVEHVERCIAPSVQGLLREKLIVRFMTELRQLAGRVDVSTKADHAVNFIVPSIESDLDHHEAWPLPRINSIKDDVQFDESMVSALSVSSSVPVGTLSPSAGQKRHLDVEVEEPTKRTRITPQPETDTINPNDITRISDSVPGATHTQVLSSTSNVDGNLRAYRKDAKLRKELEQTKGRVKEFEEAFELCQTEKEGLRHSVLHFKREAEELRKYKANADNRIEAQNGTIKNLQKERDTLKEQLEDARRQLASSAVPEVVEREQLRRERDEALAKLEREQRLREAGGRESDFFRSQYQDASSQTTKLSKRVETLTQQVRELEQLKKGERDRARQLSLSNATEAYKEEIERLTVQLQERTASLQLRNDELKAIRGRQGVGTRAGSVPRSPRVSGAPGSRGGSPAPSGLGGHGRLGALRNINA
ncbi:hypothetical protein BK809_0003911 [Diplodia seriata]|uniref:Chromo domain-containing protein n=1 Tax=Diplodia seriata TaxID=420778 RepID=A0A1S8BD41_9PEZI|nr:hypothetical protein BK809_0003911 [Diplodia seriata]